MTENSIAYALHLQYRAASELTIPRFTPLGWWECDFFRVTNSGFTSEFEIKLSASDYKSDFSKEKGEERCWDRDLRKLVQHAAVGKHDLLAEMAATGKPIPSRPGPGFPPNRFYFVLPREIAEKVEIPDYAGLVIAKPYGKRVLVDVAKKAPQLHKAKAAPEGGWTQALADSFYHRYWSGIGKLSRVDVGPSGAKGKKASVYNCRMCGNYHGGVPFYEMARPIDEWTHYAKCPKTGGPIFARITGGGLVANVYRKDGVPEP